MERKVNVRRKGPLSPRNERLEEEDVFDYPGIEDESNGSGPVSRDAHVALRKAFEDLKKRYLEGQARISELQTKQRDRKGSHERVYQERDELFRHLQKSYLAFEEKYGENEQLKKIIEDLKQSLKLHQEGAAQSEGGAQTGQSSEEKRKLGEKKYIMVEELTKIGLEVVEDNDQLFIMLTDRDSLQKWIEENSDGKLTLMIKGSASENKTTETESISTQQEGYEDKEGKKIVEAEVILLRQKIQDQAEELKRFYDVFKQAMTQNKMLRAREQSRETDGGDTKGLPTLKHEAPVKGAIAPGSAVFSHKKVDTILSTAQEQTAEVRQVKEHLEKQNKSLRTLMDITDKTIQDFERLVNAAKVTHNVPVYTDGRSPRWPEEGATSLPQGEGSFERVMGDEAPLSIPVQESNLYRAKRSDKTIEAASVTRRVTGDGNAAPFSAASSRAPEAKAVPMTTFLSENTWTGESDIEVIEEEEDFIGATSSRGKICPVCERFFPDSYGQKEFELHVNQHFEGDP